MSNREESWDPGRPRKLLRETECEVMKAWETETGQNVWEGRGHIWEIGLCGGLGIGGEGEEIV